MKEFINNFLKLERFWSILLFVLFVFLFAWVISRVIRFIVVQTIKRRKTGQEGKTNMLFFRNSVKFFVGLIALIYIIATVPTLRSKATLIFSGAGILAAIIGFAAQAALSNLIAGAFIVMFRPFRVGDYIKLDEQRMGIVEDITLRHTVINNFENKRLIIPNSIISSESILNHNIQDSHILSFNNFKIGIRADIDLAKKIIQEEAEKLEFVIDNRTPEQVLKNQPQIEVRLIEVLEGYIHLRAYIWLNNPFKEFKMKCDLKEATYKRFKTEGVSMPIPVRRIINLEE